MPLDKSIGEISLGATYVYTSEQNVNLTNPFGGIAASNLLNLNASWRNIAGHPIDLSLFMTNATNERTITAPAGVWFVFGYESFYVAPPRMWGARLKYRFGS